MSRVWIVDGIRIIGFDTGELAIAHYQKKLGVQPDKILTATEVEKTKDDEAFIAVEKRLANLFRMEK
jgi:hypothetical protein